ncbi:MAG: hypothetical protein Q7S65_06010 [Nanoarchaeota archaeon]|nr:hypothetical protein [Nanoarchaeota archaeon]
MTLDPTSQSGIGPVEMTEKNLRQLQRRGLLTATLDRTVDNLSKLELDGTVRTGLQDIFYALQDLSDQEYTQRQMDTIMGSLAGAVTAYDDPTRQARLVDGIHSVVDSARDVLDDPAIYVKLPEIAVSFAEYMRTPTDAVPTALEAQHELRRRVASRTTDSIGGMMVEYALDGKVASDALPQIREVIEEIVDIAHTNSDPNRRKRMVADALEMASMFVHTGNQLEALGVLRGYMGTRCQASDGVLDADFSHVKLALQQQLTSPLGERPDKYVFRNMLKEHTQ